MSTKDKLEERILYSKNVPNDVTPNELRALAKQKGWRVEETGGSHTKFYITKNNGVTKMYPVPLGGNKTVLPHYIKMIRQILDEE